MHGIFKKLPSQRAAGDLLQRVIGSRIRWNVSLEFGIIGAYFCLLSTSPHINQHPSPSSLPGSRLSFALKQSKPRTNIHTSTGARTHSHNSTLRSGFPIAPAHTKQNVSSDYGYWSLFASGASILNLSPPPLYNNLILYIKWLKTTQRCISNRNK